MRTAAPEPLRPIPFPRSRPGAGGRLHVAGLVAIVVVATLVAFGGAIRAGQSSVRELPPDQRAALLSRTVDELSRSCGRNRPAAVEAHCRELASFAAQFDECRGDCAALVRPLITPNPTR